MAVDRKKDGGSHYGDSAEVRKTMVEVAGVIVERVATIGMQATYSVVVGASELGEVSFGKYYEPALKAMDAYVALWAGPTLCVINRQHRTMHCIDRGDETHRIHAFETLWIVEGELNVDLFDPKSQKTLATYSHNEVITSSSFADGLVQIRDFAGAAVTLDPARSLQVVRSRPARPETGSDR